MLFVYKYYLSCHVNFFINICEIYSQFLSENGFLDYFN